MMTLCRVEIHKNSENMFHTFLYIVILYGFTGPVKPGHFSKVVRLVWLNRTASKTVAPALQIMC